MCARQIGLGKLEVLFLVSMPLSFACNGGSQGYNPDAPNERNAANPGTSSNTSTGGASNTNTGGTSGTGNRSTGGANNTSAGGSNTNTGGASNTNTGGTSGTGNTSTGGASYTNAGGTSGTGNANTGGASNTQPDATLLLTSTATGDAMLGGVTELPLAGTGTATAFHSFAGTPWIDDDDPDGFGLVWNGADNKFYGLLNGGGAYGTGVLLSFEPATDTLVLLKTLSGREYPAQAGLNGDMLEFRKADGFYRKPLLTLDGKGLLLLSSNGGVDYRGLLVHVNIDPTSPSYLTETVVYNFFDYEVRQGSYCNSLRASSAAGESEMVWGKDAQGHDVVFMGRQGSDYVVDPSTNSSTEPGNCNPYVYSGKTHDKVKGRMFALSPTDPADLTRPWQYSLGYDLFDPLLWLGRQIYWDTKHLAVRWTLSGLGDAGQLYFYAGASLGPNTYWGNIEQCYKLGGMLPIDVNGGSIVTCSGLNGSDTLPDSPPRIFAYTTNDLFSQQAALSDWYADKKLFRGTTSSLLSRRVFVNGGDDSEICQNGGLECAPSTIEEIDPVIGYSRQVLVTANKATTGTFFFGDPAVGGSIREPIAERYVVWFGWAVTGYSNTLNKYDRVTGQTTTLPFDPVAGAYPKGKLLDLGNGKALGYLDATPPPGGGARAYAGAAGNLGTNPGYYVLDLMTGAIPSMFRNGNAVTAASMEQIQLDDGSVWVAYSDAPSDQWRNIDQLNISTGALVSHYYKPEEWNYKPVDPYTLAGRKTALYLPFWQSNVSPSSSHYANVTLGCVRADDAAVVSQSDPFGPAQAAFANAHRVVYGATYSPANDAMYLATSKVADADQGTIFEIDKGIAAADLCKGKPVVTAIVTGLLDVPSTRPLSTRAGALFYGTASGKLMRLDAAGKSVALVADLKSASAATSQVRGYLAETLDNVVAAVVFDYDASGANTARRLVSVAVGTATVTSQDITGFIDEFEPYPGVMRRN